MSISRFFASEIRFFNICFTNANKDSYRLSWDDKYEELCKKQNIKQYNIVDKEKEMPVFENVYFNPIAKSEESKAGEMMTLLYEYFCKNIDKIPEEYRRNIGEICSKERAVCDYLACMSDRYAVVTFQNLFIPKKWSK